MGSCRWFVAQVEGKVVSEIGQGLLCYVGIGSGDTEDDANYMCDGCVGPCTPAVLRLRLPGPCILDRGGAPVPPRQPRTTLPCHSLPARHAHPAQNPCSIRKITGVRLWPSEDGAKPWHRSVQGVGGEILCVSQFTLFGRLSGNKPDYSKAMPPAQAKEMYEGFLTLLRSAHPGDKVQDGVFGAMMNVLSVNEGPVTWHIDSRQR